MARKPKNPVSFEETLQALESIVARLESGGLSLDESLDEFERGVKLAKKGKQRLQSAEQRIEMLLDESVDSDLIKFKINKE